MAFSGLAELRRAAVDHTLFTPTHLVGAVERLGFVQADPIRAPARAQDLILRHRVAGYKAGDLERLYPGLPLIEDMIHVYGFVHRALRPLLYPRRITRTFHVEDDHPHLRRAILQYLKEHGASHPRTIEQALAQRYEKAAIVNAWGGQSNATTRMLEVLHYRGLLHVVRRERGVRVYALDEPLVDEDDASVVDRVVERTAALTPQQRADGIIELLVSLYAPLPMASLTQLTLMLGERAMARDALRARIPVLLRKGVLRLSKIEGLDYIRTAIDPLPRKRDLWSIPAVRFLAPFDPLVWDRRRFLHLWDWRYRFEAYVPAEKRKLGYYALPLLWETENDARVIGWVNVTRSESRQLVVEAGYVGRKPAGSVYRNAFDAEVARLEAFLVRDEANEATGDAAVEAAPA